MKAKKEKEYSVRFRRHANELKWLYCELYHNDLKAYDYFTEMLYRMWEERPEKLKMMDRAREECPDWYKGHELVGMLMYVKAFAGTLKGVKNKLDYVAESGVNYLHLMPLLESPEGRSDGGYAVSDFRKVQPELGTMEDLAELADACHERGIAVCLDFVMNHTSEDHEWARRARAGEKEYQHRYFFYDDWTIPNAYEQTVPQVFPTTAPGNFTWCEEARKVVMTTFYPYQWDLNYANPTVFNDMTENMLFLCNHGVDVIRLDAVPYIWKALGTTCRNLLQVHTLVRMMRIVCEIVCPGTLLLGEVVMEPSKVVPYFGTVEKPECHLLYNVTTMATIWHTVATRDVRLLVHQLRQVFSLPKEYTFLNYLRCHDDIGWGSLCGIEAARESGDALAMEEAIRLDIMLHAFIFTLSGVPVLYSGDEIAQENDKTYHDDPLKREDSRWLHRGDMDWNKALLRTQQDTPEGRVFTAIGELEARRAEHAAFDTEADTWILDTGNNHILGIGRYYRKEQILALFNFGAEDATAWLRDEKEYTDLIDGTVSDAGAVKVPAGGFRWLCHKF